MAGGAVRDIENVRSSDRICGWCGCYIVAISFVYRICLIRMAALAPFPGIILDRVIHLRVDMAHDLTKKIYCTNCHSKYNETSGDIVIYSGISGLKQSAHYIIDKTDDQLYNNSKGFFSDPE